MNLKEYNIDTPEEKIIEIFQNIHSNVTDPRYQPATVSYLTNILFLKSQKKLLDEQNKFNERIINQNKWLTYGTWALVLATVLLLFCN